jgi:hypothetical protein
MSVPHASEDAVTRPSQFCAELLISLEASEGRRKRRKRDTRPDAIGLRMKQELLEDAVAADPEPDVFEEWLMQRCLAAGDDGGVRAMALSIHDEWQLTCALGGLRQWLAAGAPSDDR